MSFHCILSPNIPASQGCNTKLGSGEKTVSDVEGGASPGVFSCQERVLAPDVTRKLKGREGWECVKVEWWEGRKITSFLKHQKKVIPVLHWNQNLLWKILQKIQAKMKTGNNVPVRHDCFCTWALCAAGDGWQEGGRAEQPQRGCRMGPGHWGGLVMAGKAGQENPLDTKTPLTHSPAQEFTPGRPTGSWECLSWEQTPVQKKENSEKSENDSPENA